MSWRRKLSVPRWKWKCINVCKSNQAECETFRAKNYSNLKWSHCSNCESGAIIDRHPDNLLCMILAAHVTRRPSFPRWLCEKFCHHRHPPISQPLLHPTSHPYSWGNDYSDQLTLYAIGIPRMPCYYHWLRLSRIELCCDLQAFAHADQHVRTVRVTMLATKGLLMNCCVGDKRN